MNFIFGLLKRRWPRRLLFLLLLTGVVPLKNFMQSGQMQTLMSKFGYQVKPAASTPSVKKGDLREFTATVDHVADGDSLQVKHQGETVKVRLFGIDAPEKGQEFANMSRQRLKNLANGRQVKVSVVEKDKYGRLISKVWLDDGTLLNHAMVGSGLAWWYERYAPGDSELRKLQANAKSSQLGLWKSSSPTPPWDFKENQRSKTW